MTMTTNNNITGSCPRCFAYRWLGDNYGKTCMECGHSEYYKEEEQEEEWGREKL
jgi:hypothetical protein